MSVLPGGEPTEEAWTGTRLWDESAPPTHAQARAATEVARELAERVVVEEDDRVRKIAVQEARTVSRRSALVMLMVALLVPLLVSALAWQSAQSAAGLAAAASRDAEVALQRLDEANNVLEARGQPPVQPPPAQDDPSQVEAAAITAQVLASLPETPSAQQVADLLRGAVVGQLQGPTFDELARLTADYFAGIPAPPGPTEEQIRAAVAREYAANPPRAGRDGRDGVAGRDGVDGAPGEDGRAVVSGPTPVRGDDGQCVWRTTYDQAPLVEEHPAGDAACPPPPDATTTPMTPPLLPP